jgi:hypothetical protein
VIEELAGRMEAAGKLDQFLNVLQPPLCGFGRLARSIAR